MTSILVTGGTGTLGRAVVRRLTEAGVPVRVLSRHAATGDRGGGGDRAGGGESAVGQEHAVGDLVAGHGLAAALSGVDTVIHLATTLRGGRDVTATRNLVAAAEGVRHLVFVSIVGVDRIPLGYYRGKLAAERVVAEVPHTILRATQFHDLIRTLLAGAAKLPVMPLPTMRAQPVDVRDVAARLVELALDEPRGRAPDFGGPEVMTLDALATEYLRATNRRRARLALRLPGKVFRGYRAGANLAPAGNPTGTITFAEYLKEVTS